MGKITILFGIALIVLGVVGFVATGSTHMTALIPAYFGPALVLLGGMAIAKPSLNKHVMHAAVLIALIGFGGTVGGAIALLRSMGGTPLTSTEHAAALAKTIMAVLMLIYIVLCVRSFIAARKARKAATA